MKVGVILYSVRDHMEKNPIQTAEEVAGLGYKYLEVCNHNAMEDPGCGFGIDAAVLKSVLDGFGAQVVSTHVFPFERADVKAVLEYNRTLGNKNIVVPMGRFDSYDDLMRQCEYFNQMGKICAEEGMTYLYHNHNHEFRTIFGKTIMDWLMENTDPEYLSLELDTFWVMRAGLCPVRQIRHLGKRIKLIHQKDFAWDSIVPINLNGLTDEERELKQGESVGWDSRSFFGENGEMLMDEEESEEELRENTAFAEIGEGIMQIQEIIDAANKYSSAEYCILEQDSTRMESQMASIAKSMESFRRFSGITWD